MNASSPLLARKAQEKPLYSKKLAAEAGKPYITTGDIIRDLAANDEGPLGEECRIMFAEHRYLDGHTLLKILVHRFSQNDTTDGLILHGGLRTVEETLAFQEMLEEAGRIMPLTVIHLRIPGWMSFDRLLLGDNARKRKDDSVEGIMSRLSKFYLQLDERVALIENQPDWTLFHINAGQPIETVYDEVRQIFRQKIPTQL